MKIKEIIIIILSEIQSILFTLCEQEIDRFAKRILCAKRIFVSGAGRSGILVRAFAMRLMQMGFTTYVVGETITPAVVEDDLLVMISGSGETQSSYFILKEAKKAGAYTYLITARSASSMGKIAQEKIVIPGPTKLSFFNKEKSKQFLGSLFEQGTFIFLESIIQQVGAKKKMSSKNIMLRHANLE